jgi:hypothetical protein
MANVEDIVAHMRDRPADVRFSDACKVCDYYFGQARQNSSSHRVYKTPWPGNPRVNIQKGKNGKAKEYQIVQILKAIDILEGNQ